MPKLSIIILSYNTKDITRKCIESLLSSLKNSRNLESEIIIIDNASSDGSREMLSSEFKKKRVIGSTTISTYFNLRNKGYPAANNQGLNLASGKYVLFLNSDVIVDKVDFSTLCAYLDREPTVGALTVKVLLPNGLLDQASHRGFPSVWNSFTYFTKLEKAFGKFPILGRLFGRYHLTYLSLDDLHEIDSPTGAFFLTKKNLLTSLGGFDEDYFMYGEDIDLAYRIKKKEYRIIFYPSMWVTHLKYASGLKKANARTIKKIKFYFYEAMKIFYRKHYASSSPQLLNNFVYFLIDLKKKLA